MNTTGVQSIAEDDLSAEDTPGTPRGDQLNFGSRRRKQFGSNSEHDALDVEIDRTRIDRRMVKFDPNVSPLRHASMSITAGRALVPNVRQHGQVRGKGRYGPGSVFLLCDQGSSDVVATGLLYLW
jgi:hypothetical protein